MRLDVVSLQGERAWYHKERAEEVIRNLFKRNMSGYYTANRDKALSLALSRVPPGALVARGDSLTIEQVGILSAVRKRNQNALLDPFATDDKGSLVLATEARRKIQREAFSSDIFLTGANAITLDGRLVNVDGTGARVAALIFGPKKVIIVAGVNKIVKDVDAALARIREFAAPLNVKRHAMTLQRSEYEDLPCAKTGICANCSSDWRICRYTVIVEGSMLSQKGRIEVILVGEDLGI